MEEKKITDSSDTRQNFEQLALRRFIYVPSFEIYDAAAGFYDYGPPGCAIMSHLIAKWRQHFVLNEDMLEVSCSVITPDIVLETSGHVAKFTAYMVKDEKTGESFRVDKLLNERFDYLIQNGSLSSDQINELEIIRPRLDSMNAYQLQQVINKHHDKSDLSFPIPFSSMFKTSIGPMGNKLGYLRPETAQGIFVNFNRLYKYNCQQLPFAAAQIGSVFRNEISPRQGLLRVREFTLAEVEHFCNPSDKTHFKFPEIADLCLTLLPRPMETWDIIKNVMMKNVENIKVQIQSMTCRDAVDKKIIDNQVLAYYMARTHLFLTVSCGLSPTKIRFRQHLKDEMAHYANDCWDCEILTSHGWIECVGHADRGSYDLESHSRASGHTLCATEIFNPPIARRTTNIKINSSLIGTTFRADIGKVKEYLKNLEQDEKLAMKFKDQIKIGPVWIPNIDKPLTSDMIETIESKIEYIRSKKIIPHVIEPSYGMGRILYAVLENSYYTRNDTFEEAFSSTDLHSKEESKNKENEESKEKVKEKQVPAVLKLPLSLAPFICAIFPLISQDELENISSSVSQGFHTAGISSKMDLSGVSIGRKYARADEIGIPFSITCDSKDSVTLRERDSMSQVRIPIDKIHFIVNELALGITTWDVIYTTWPKHLHSSPV